MLDCDQCLAERPPCAEHQRRRRLNDCELTDCNRVGQRANYHGNNPANRPLRNSVSETVMKRPHNSDAISFAQLHGNPRLDIGQTSSAPF